MTESTPPSLSILVDTPFRVPAYLAPARDQFLGQQEDLAKALGSFLGRSVSTTSQESLRAMGRAPNTEESVMFDLNHIDGAHSIRLTVNNGVLDRICEILFGGSVDEPSLRLKVVEAMTTRLAEVIMGPADAFGPGIAPASEDVLDAKRPVMIVSFGFEIDGDSNDAIGLDFELARSYTDSLSPASASLPAEVINSVPFTLLAILGDHLFKIDDVDNWRTGSIVPLGKARLETIDMRAVTAEDPVPLASGEMGSDEDRRCIRLTHMAGDAPMAPAASAGFSAMDGGSPMGDMPDMGGMGDMGDADPMPDFAPMGDAIGDGMADGNDDGDGMPDFDDFPKMNVDSAMG